MLFIYFLFLFSVAAGNAGVLRAVIGGKHGRPPPVVKAKGAYTAHDGSQIGPGGGGVWGFWTLCVRYGKTVHAPGRGNEYVAENGGEIELATPRGVGSDKFYPEDIENLKGALSVRVTVKRKAP